MRWSKRRRGSHTPSGNWKISMSHTPTRVVCRQRAHSTLNVASVVEGTVGRHHHIVGLWLGTREQGPLTQGIRHPVAPCCGHVVQAVCMAS